MIVTYAFVNSPHLECKNAVTLITIAEQSINYLLQKYTTKLITSKKLCHFSVSKFSTFATFLAKRQINHINLCLIRTSAIVTIKENMYRK